MSSYQRSMIDTVEACGRTLLDTIVSITSLLILVLLFLLSGQVFQMSRTLPLQLGDSTCKNFDSYAQRP